jgi:hypothetical protein
LLSDVHQQKQTMKKYMPFIAFSLIALQATFAQVKESHYIKEDVTTTVSVQSIKDLQKGSQRGIKKNKALEMVWTAMQKTPVPINDFFEKSSPNQTGIPPLKKNAAIVVVSHHIENNIEDTTRLTVNVLHMEKEFDLCGERAWSDYLLNTKEILLVLVGRTAEVDSIRFENETSFLGASFQGVIKAINETFTKMSPVVGADKTNIPLRLIQLNKKKLMAPGVLSFSVPYFKEGKVALQSASFKIHERNHLAFSLGVPTSQLDKKQFSLNNDTLKVALDSTQKEEWKSNLSVGLEFYPFGRDIDRFTPIWKKPLYRPWERMGFYGGVKLSSKPLDAIYAGISMSLSKEVALIAGVSWIKTADVQDATASDGADLEKAMKETSMSREQAFYLGITLSPSLMLKSLK